MKKPEDINSKTQTNNESSLAPMPHERMQEEQDQWNEEMAKAEPDWEGFRRLVREMD